MFPARPRGESVTSEGANRGRRHLSIKLGLDQLQDIVARNAPTDDQFDKLRAMRRQYQEAEDGPAMNLELLAAQNKQNQEEDLSSYTFKKYGEIHFNQKKKMLGKKYVLAELLKYSEAPLKRPLHKLSHSNIEKKAVNASKLVFNFIERPSEDETASYRTLVHLLNIAVTDAPQELRDEIFCQIVKQVNENPDPLSVFRGWQLLSLCCGAFPPSKTLEQTLKNFIDANIGNLTYGHPHEADENMLTVADFASYARLRLDKSIEVGPRNQLPTKGEVESVMSRRPVTVPVFLVNGTEIKMQVETWMTINDLRKSLSQYLEVKETFKFAIIESSEDSSERTLQFEERVLDIMSEWEQEYNSHKNPELAPKNHFVFRIRLFLPIDPSDERATELAYYQAVYDVTDGRYPITEEDIIQLIALQAQEKFGSFNPQTGNPWQTTDEFMLYLPVQYHFKAHEMKEKVVETYQAFSGYSTQNAMKAYLNIVQEIPSYGCAIYPVHPLNNPDFPSECYIAINGKAVFIIDPATKNFLAEFSWEKIVTWGYNDQKNLKKKKSSENEKSFCIIMGNFMQQTKLFFKTYQAFEVYKLIEDYGNSIKGYKSPSL